MKQKVQFHIDALLNSYSQVFFSLNKWLALLIMVATFLKPHVGLVALLSVLFANTTIYLLGYQLKAIREGMYGFNVLLLAVALSNLFNINSAFVVLMLVSVILVSIITISMSHFFERHFLPAVSIPFFAAFWIIKLATPNFSGLFLNLDDVYWLNSTYKIGGWDLIKFDNFFETLNIPLFAQIYLKSLGSVFFVPYVFAGLIICTGILAFSRIAFSLSIVAFYVAWKGCILFGYDQENLIVGLTGSNIIFTAIGIGCFYLVPNVATYILALVLVPLTLLLCNTFAAILQPWALPAMTMPFAFITVLTLHALRMRLIPYFFKFVDIQYYSPEKVVYKSQNINERFSNVFPIKFQLPVMGKWFVSQAYNGSITHKGMFDKAIDFVITEDESEKTFSKDGINLDDYYCYAKPVLAPASGYISNINDNIDDNRIKDVNLDKNWGNTVVIYHAEGVYSQLSHLKKDSIKVQIGDYVKSGDIIAQCGSSGRSPEPHLHYQIQQHYNIGGSTVQYPFAYYIEHQGSKLAFNEYKVPNEKAVVENIQINKLLSETFYFIPGKKFKFKVEKNDADNDIESWEVFTDVYNRTYIYCHSTSSIAYFVNDGSVFYFTDFEGDKNSFLFYFYLGCYKVLLAYYQDLEIEDSIPSDVFNYILLQPFQDLVSPFFTFIQANYHIKYNFIDDVYNSSRIELKSIVETHTGNKRWREMKFDIIIEEGKIASMTCTANNKKISAATWLD
jgi:urea transporter/murein DD-endopeptidase MepM/ murein hydrolase activator NlpD